MTERELKVPLFLTHLEIALVTSGLSELRTKVLAGVPTCGTLQDVDQAITRIFRQAYPDISDDRSGATPKT